MAEIAFFAAIFFSLSLRVSALEDRFDDLSASVEVAPVFGLSLDRSNLNFGMVSPGQTTLLGEGSYYQELKCRSNSGRSWQLKAQLVSLKHMGKSVSLPPESLKWKIVSSTGQAPQASSDFQPFAAEPVLVYTSYGSDWQGREVILRLQYSLTSPPTAPEGSYVGQVVFTMVEG